MYSRHVAGLVAGLIALASSATAETHTVLVQNFEFVPPTITIQEGDTVHWELVAGTHTVTSGSGCTADGEFDSGLLGPTGFDWTFSSTGTTDYFCAISTHCSVLGMEGSVEVVAAGASAPSAGLGLVLVVLIAAASGGVVVLRRRSLA